MHIRGVIATLGILAMLFGLGMLAPTVVDFYYGTGQALHFVMASLMVIALGLVMKRLGGQVEYQLSHRDGFLIVSLAWVMLSVLGAVPLWTTGVCHTFWDGFFESASGLTTTGSTVLSGLDSTPPAVLFWRSMEQWLGGMGIIVLAVAVMPLLGVGGMQLFRAEVPGPVKDKLTARVAETAKALWYIYFGITVACAICLWLAGMNKFDAINHAMCTLATGGFSTHDASLGYYHSNLIDWVTIVFMFLGSVNFNLHFAALRRGLSLGAYLQDEEFVAYIKWLAFILFAIGIVAVPHGATVTDVVFNTVSLVSTTGFVSVDYSLWPPVTGILLIIGMLISGCAGSTSGGGIKVVRMLLLFRQGKRELRRLIHPHAVIQIKLGLTRIPESVVQALWGFLALYVVCFGILVTLVALTGVDMISSISAVVTCVTNSGPGFGVVGPASNFGGLPAAAKGILAFAMIIGRLEIFSFFVLLIPEFWRR
ncbi:MAG TPA: potassium transporter TrkG [Mariprofundaceae bacterium]|nr:potassium transporter TrkG [Mariprofundaceae bacterium]